MGIKDHEIYNIIYDLKGANYLEAATAIELLFDMIKSQREEINQLKKQVAAGKIIVGSFP